MNRKTELVFRGFLELSSSEQAEFIREIKKYFDSDEYGRKQILTESKRISLGPLSSETCPCCGR